MLSAPALAVAIYPVWRIHDNEAQPEPSLLEVSRSAFPMLPLHPILTTTIIISIQPNSILLASQVEGYRTLSLGGDRRRIRRQNHFAIFADNPTLGFDEARGLGLGYRVTSGAIG